MRPLFVLPAVLVPLTLVILAVVVRRIGEAVGDLRNELGRLSATRAEVNALRGDIDRLYQRGARRPRPIGNRPAH